MGRGIFARATASDATAERTAPRFIAWWHAAPASEATAKAPTIRTRRFADHLSGVLMNTTFLTQPDRLTATVGSGSPSLRVSTINANDLHPSGVPGDFCFGDPAPARRLLRTTPAPQLQSSGRPGPPNSMLKAYRLRAELATSGRGNGDGKVRDRIGGHLSEP